jgi:hypothetical protein
MAVEAKRRVEMREALYILLSSIMVYLAHHFLSIRESMAS